MTAGPQNASEPLGRASDLLERQQFADLEAAVLPFAIAGHREARALLAIALALRDEDERALHLLAQLARERPAEAHPIDRFAQTLRRLGHAEKAAAIGRALHHRHDPLPALSAAGQGHRIEQAAEAADKRNLQAVSAAEQGRFDEAETLFRSLLAANPQNVRARANLGRLLVAQGAFEDGLAHLTRALEQQPGNVQLSVNYATALLKAGCLADGWPAFEARLRQPGHGDLPRELLLPTLRDGGHRDLLRGRIILVTQEEGFGDFIQMMRYLPLLSRGGARVLVWAPPELARLMRAVRGIEVLCGDVEQVEFDWHCPILSLPRAFGTGLEDIPPPLPLAADAVLARSWAARLPPRPEARVGIVWGGSPRPTNPAASRIDRQRSLPLEALAPLAEVPGLVLVSLQKGRSADRLRTAPPPFVLHDIMDEVQDFADTAALIDGLDAVVSVDTSVAHLAASMGKPVLLLDRYDNCWRWLHGRQDSPWYPTLRIFRQSRPGDWSGPVSRVAQALVEVASR